MLREQNERWDVQEDDELEDAESGLDKNDYLICSKCGRILHESQKDYIDCECGASNLVRIRKAEIKGTRAEHRCPCCNTGHMKMFYIGYDAATAVLGTELFEQLPEKETVLKSKTGDSQTTGGLFSMAMGG